ncbi:hypothetical protein [Nocardioides marmorisolisilvae]|uniref:Uncharacterized protein n=1 Tax=Nocardioides marmorisolisilvae TaxID=1542737 RepID=A0A3N0DRP0_9ACTN|nr:hypothetical protein [Nocardioides marmorisolisilvae]RNL78299.1 hypothetical protein EFL95_04105 [Nocardioides marmorisolisilvae]
MKIILRTATTALGFLSLVGAGLVGQAAPASASTTTSFHAVWTGAVKVVLPNKFVFDLAGPADQMGATTVHAVATVNGLGLTCLAGLANTNVVQISGPDGTLTLTSKDVGCPNGVGTFHGTGVYTVTDGTGRYAGATGQGTLVGGADILTSTAQITADGTLTLP